MGIKKIKIKNFKIFKDWFTLDLKEGINIIVGNNSEGKSTILEAIALALTGNYRGKLLRNNLTQDIFNKDCVNEYLCNKDSEPPEVRIELYFTDEQNVANFIGDDNSDEAVNIPGLSLTVRMNDELESEYNKYNKDNIKSIPIEYYDVYWQSFARTTLVRKLIPLYTSIIETSNISSIRTIDPQVSRMIKDYLSDDNKLNIRKEFRELVDNCNKNITMNSIPEDVRRLHEKEIALQIGFSGNTNWEDIIFPTVDNIPFNFEGQGDQCIIKTMLSLLERPKKDSEVLLIEEPENHLSHTSLHQLLAYIEQRISEKQVIIATHSSFVANKLGLSNLILLSNKQTITFNDLNETTVNFFKKVAGYDTLRAVLSKKAILVEGDSDELIIQKAFMKKFNGSLPIHHGIDVISVGTSFLRFLEIADKINLKITVVTDNDGDIQSLNEKYKDYFNNCNIKICFDKEVYGYHGTLKNYNNNTLEPCLYRANSLEKLNKVLNKNFLDADELLDYMRKNKTETALSIFESKIDIDYPNYILEAISND